MKKCIISIDVGVKNLAICVLCQDTAGVIQVPYWKWFNVVDADLANGKRKKKEKASIETQYGQCVNMIKRTGKPCGKKGVINTRGRAYCGHHDPSRKHSADDTQQWCHAMLQRLPGITEDITKTLQSIKDTPFEKILPVLNVIIEQQSTDNKRILLQSHVIFAHFVSMYDNAVPVRFTPAYNKLLAYEGPEITCTLKTPYAKRKFLARKHTEYFLDKMDHMRQWKDFFVSCKSKQDDIADAFLQGLYVLTKGLSYKLSDTTTTVVKKRRRKVRF